LYGIYMKRASYVYLTHWVKTQRYVSVVALRLIISYYKFS
jgi:hypothetical protein